MAKAAVVSTVRRFMAFPSLNCGTNLKLGGKLPPVHSAGSYGIATVQFALEGMQAVILPAHLRLRQKQRITDNIVSLRS